MPHGLPRAVQRRLAYTALLSLVASTSAQDSNTLDCSTTLNVNGVDYSLASLSSEQTLNRTRESPPTTIDDELRFNVCQDLGRKNGVADADQCPTGTRACLTKTNKKLGETNRIFAAIPVAQTSTLEPAYSALQSPAGLSVILHGSSWPPNGSPSTPQSLNLTLLCTQDGTLAPTFTKYEDGVVSVEWNTTAGCPAKQSDGGNDGDGNGGGNGDGEKEVEGGHSTGGSGIGWFFLFLFLAFVGYFALGAYYNYNNFGATGWDLVPHRDFWRDVPYLFRDFTEHLCSTLRPGRQGGSRRGYMAV